MNRPELDTISFSLYCGHIDRLGKRIFVNRLVTTEALNRSCLTCSGPTHRSGETVGDIGRRFGVNSRRELLLFLFLLFELDIAFGLCKDFALFGEDGVEDERDLDRGFRRFRRSTHCDSSVPSATSAVKKLRLERRLHPKMRGTKKSDCVTKGED